MDPMIHFLGAWSGTLGAGSILFRLALSCCYAGVIGCERAKKRHSAGLRTFILVALGATVATLVERFIGELSNDWMPLSAATIIGIALISSSSILYSAKGQVKGLTTAMALWATTLIGIANGAGFYSVALLAFVAQMLCLALLPELEAHLKNRSNHFEIHLELKDSRKLAEFITTLRRLGVVIDDIEVNTAYVNSGLSVYTIALAVTSPELKKYKEHREIIEALRSLEYIAHIEELT